jgi:hypothetical protein
VPLEEKRRLFSLYTRYRGLTLPFAFRVDHGDGFRNIRLFRGVQPLYARAQMSTQSNDNTQSCFQFYTNHYSV